MIAPVCLHLTDQLIDEPVLNHYHYHRWYRTTPGQTAAILAADSDLTIAALPAVYQYSTALPAVYWYSTALPAANRLLLLYLQPTDFYCFRLQPTDFYCFHLQPNQHLAALLPFYSATSIKKNCQKLLMELSEVDNGSGAYYLWYPIDPDSN